MLASKIRYITWVHLWGTNGAGAAENHHLCALSSKNFGLARLQPPASRSLQGRGRRKPSKASERRKFARSTCYSPTRQREPQDRRDPDRLRGTGKLPLELSSAGKRLLRGNREHRPPLEEDERCPLGKVLPDGRRKARSTPALALRCRRRPARFRRLDRPRSPSAPDDRQHAAPGDRLHAQAGAR